MTPDQIDRAHVLYYDAGRTQREVAEALGTTQTVIFKHMRRRGWKPRPAARRNQRGVSNPAYRVDSTNYDTMHRRVESRRGRARTHLCYCGSTARDWANLTGSYEDTDDYAAMCRPCHRRYDDARRSMEN